MNASASWATVRLNASAGLLGLTDIPVNSYDITFGRSVFRWTVFAIGLMLNSLILIVVSCSRQLRYPRHLCWAAVSMIDILFLVECILEIAARSDQVACQFFVLIAGVDYSVLLVCLSVAALDRYLAIAHYQWYKKRLTNRLAFYILGITCGSTFTVMTSPFWTGFLSIRTCTVNMTVIYWFFTWDLIVGIMCVVLHVKIYLKSRGTIRKYIPNSVNGTDSFLRRAPITLKFVSQPSVIRSPHQHHSVNPDQYQQGEQGALDSKVGELTAVKMTPCPLSPTSGKGKNMQFVEPRKNSTARDFTPYIEDHAGVQCFPALFQPRDRISRLEISAALNLSINVLPFWVCTFPVTIHAISLYWCVRFGADCTTIVEIGSYLRDLFLFHSIYNPVMYMSTSAEFRRAFFHLSWKFKNDIAIHDSSC